MTDDLLNVADIMRERQVQLMRTAIAVLTLVLVVFGVKAVIAGIALHIGAAAFAFFVVAVAYLYSRVGAVGTSLTLLFVAFWICIAVALITSGSTRWVTSGWFAILVMLAGILGGRRYCLSWAAISVVTLLGFWGLQRIGLEVEHLAVKDPIVDARLHAVAQLLVATTVALAYTHANAALQRTLEAQADRLQHEVELRQQAQAAAQQSEAAKSLFLSNMSHEIRTPLNSIIGFSSRLIKRQCLIDPKDQSAVHSVLRNGKVLLNLVNDLLELSNLESLQLQYSEQPFSCNELLREGVAAVEPTAREYGLYVRAHCFDDIAMHADQVRVHQILTNLMYFCIAHTREGGIELSLARVVHDGVAGARVQITDTSSGLAPTKLEGPGDGQYQVMLNTDRELPISALSLALASKLVALHNGRMSMESELGHGTRFEIWLPLGRARDR